MCAQTIILAALYTNVIEPKSGTCYIGDMQPLDIKASETHVHIHCTHVHKLYIYVAKHMPYAHHVMLDQNTLIHNTLQDSHTVLQCKRVKGNNIIYKKRFTRPLLTQCQTV